MKVISKDEKQYHTECKNCEALLEFTSDDVFTGGYGMPYITCPECGTNIEVDEINPSLMKNITKENIVFPQDFANCDNAVHIDDATTNKYIRECLSYLEKQKEDYGTYVLTGSGDTLVLVTKYEDEYNIYVTQKYYDTSILRESTK